MDNDLRWTPPKFYVLVAQVTSEDKAFRDSKVSIEWMMRFLSLANSCLDESEIAS